MLCCVLFIIAGQTLKEKLKTKRKKMLDEPKKMLNVLVGNNRFREFKYLCFLNETTMSKVINDFIDKYVVDGKKEWADKINAPKPKGN